MNKFIKTIFTALFFLFLAEGNAQKDSMKHLQFNQTESIKTGEGKYQLIFKGRVEKGWQLYAPNQLILEEKTSRLEFSDSSIVQKSDYTYGLPAKKIKSPVFESDVEIFDDSFEWKTDIEIKGTVPETLQGTLYYTYGNDEEYNPSTVFPYSVKLEGGVKTAAKIKIASIDINNPVNNCGDEGTKNKSLLAIFFLGILGGLIALLTPCVFPMIPVTVTFFTKKSQTRKQGITNAVLYGFFIFLIYILITLPFHIAGNTSPEIFNNISTNIWLNLLFFAIFVFFALSFFGLFEIGLPAGLANKMDSKSGLGNIGGIFFMAATLAIVSFSCTGPILGTLLVGVADQGAWPLTAGAAGFGIALGLPFALFAMFPNWLQSLPKSGGWMTDVKVILGFLELALAIKFLSNADLVKQWGLLKREIFIGLWIIIGVMMVLYLFGIIKVKHSSPLKKFSFGRIATITLLGAITIYLIQGLFTSKLNLISGFPPPKSYSIFKEDKTKNNLIEPIHNDYKGALEKARKENKPVLIDFTGWACVNCRKMEEKIWPDKIVDSLMRNEFVVVSLYVDERKNLPLTEQTVEKLANGADKSIVTVGDKWATFQTENFGATAQPQYVILSPDEKALTKTKFFTEDAEVFAKWLECGLEAYKKNSSGK